MGVRLNVVLVSSVLAFAGCSAETSQPSANGSQPVVASSPSIASASPVIQPGTAPTNIAGVKPKLDACALLTSKEIESVQGEAIKETKLSGQAAGGFSMSQCFYTLPTFTNSVSLMVANRGEGAGSHDPKEFGVTLSTKKKKPPNKKKRKKRVPPPKKKKGGGGRVFWRGGWWGGVFFMKKNYYLPISFFVVVNQPKKKKKEGAGPKSAGGGGKRRPFPTPLFFPSAAEHLLPASLIC